MAITKKFNIAPYYNTHDELNQYLRVLFRPGFSVQTRELQELQSILQDQISRVSDNLYENGSSITGGELKIDTSLPYIKLQNAPTNFSDANDYIGLTISTGEDTSIDPILHAGIEATVVYVAEAEGTDEFTFYLNYTVAGKIQDLVGRVEASQILPPTDKAGLDALIVGAEAEAAVGKYIEVTDETLYGSNVVYTIYRDGSTYLYRLANEVYDTISTFASDQVLNIIHANGAPFEPVQVVDDVEAVGVGTVAHITQGIYYVDRHMVLVKAQSAVISKYFDISVVPTDEDSPEQQALYFSNEDLIIGLKLNEVIVTPNANIDLLDNAQGAPNFAAPGAHRYQVIPVLKRKEATDTEGFVEIAKAKYGEIQYTARNTEFAVIEDAMARRTYDESGDYIIDEFDIAVKPHLADADGEGFYPAEYGGDESKVVAALDAGKAYVRGFEIQTDGQVRLDIDKARDVAEADNVFVPMSLGNYVTVNTIEGIPNDFEIVDLVDGASAVIGQAYLRTMVAESSTLFRLYLFGITFNTGKTIADVVTLEQGTFTSVISQNVVHDIENNKSLFSFPLGIVSGVSDTQYDAIKLIEGGLTATSGADSIVNITVAAPYQFVSGNASDYVIQIGANAAATSGLPDSVTANGNTATLNINSYAVADGQAVRVFARVTKVDGNETRRRTKTRQTATMSVDYTTVTSAPMNLLHADVIGITSIYKATATEAQRADQAYRFDDLFDFDGGQRDNFYDLGAITIKAGQDIPTEDYVVEYEYYGHGAGDYFTRDSYSDDYIDIPSYTDKNENTYHLASTIDFRPTINVAQDAFTATSAFYPNSSVESTYEFYLARADLICLDKNGVFTVKRGTPEINPTAPEAPIDAIVLYELFIPPYTFKASDIKVDKQDHRRYTMKDIGALAKRVNHLEYYTTLSLLEMDANSQVFVDKFKVGFIVDNFESQNVADTNNDDLRIAIDPEKSEARPESNTLSVNLEPVLASQQNVSVNDDIITLDYSEVQTTSQPLASRLERINPFILFNWDGLVSIKPSSDYWMTEKQVPAVTATNTFNRAVTRVGPASAGTVWDNWRTIWAGQPITKTDTTRQSQGLFNVDTTTATTSRAVIQNKTGAATKTTVSATTKYLGNFVVNTGIAPYIRTRKVKYSANGLKPNTRLFAFFDGVDVSDFCTPSGLPQGAPIMTSGTGSVEGVFDIPNSAILKFRTGKRKFTISDDQFGTGNSSTEATATYTASGRVTEFQKKYLTTRVVTATTTVSSASRTTNQVTGVSTRTEVKPKTRTKCLTYRTYRYGYRGVFKTAPDLSTKVNVCWNFEGRGNAVLYVYGGTTTANVLLEKKTISGSGCQAFDSGPSDNSTNYNVFDVRVIHPSSYVNMRVCYQEEVQGAPAPSSGRYDPLAQSFIVSEDGGAFLTGTELYFGPEIVDNTFPVRVQIREMINGYPGPTIIPLSDVILSPAELLAASNGGSYEDATRATRFDFSAPVFLEQDVEYCFVVLSNSETLNLWTCKLGENERAPNDTVRNTGRQITKQTNLGSLFKSQNNRTWTAVQDQDIKFNLFRASFVTGVEGAIQFQNKVEIGEELSEADPFIKDDIYTTIETTTGSSIIKMNQHSHSMRLGDKVVLRSKLMAEIVNEVANSPEVADGGQKGQDTEALIDALTINGIPYREIFDNEFTIIDDVGVDHYYVDIGNTVATINGTHTNDTILATQHVGYSTAYFLVEDIVPNRTNIDWSFAGYDKESGAADVSAKSIKVNENITLARARTIISNTDPLATNGALPADAKVNLYATMTTDKENISPVIDNERVALLATSNRINNFVDHDTGPVAMTAESKNAASRYILKPVSLVNPADEILVHIDANVPSQTAFDVYYRTQETGSESAFEDIVWTLMTKTSTNLPNEDVNDSSEYVYSATGITEFSKMSVKIVLRSASEAKVPRISNLRINALKGV